MAEKQKIGDILYHLRTQGTGSEGIHIRHVDFLWPLGEGDPTVRAGNNPYDREKRKSRLELIVPLIPGPIFAFLEFLYNFWAYRHFNALLKEKEYLFIYERHYFFNALLKEKEYLFIYERHYFFSIAAGLAARKHRVPLVVEINELAGFKRVRKNHLTALAKWCERSLFKNDTPKSRLRRFT